MRRKGENRYLLDWLEGSMGGSEEAGEETVTVKMRDEQAWTRATAVGTDGLTWLQRSNDLEIA